MLPGQAAPPARTVTHAAAARKKSVDKILKSNWLYRKPLIFKEKNYGNQPQTSNRQPAAHAYDSVGHYRICR